MLILFFSCLAGYDSRAHSGMDPLPVRTAGQHTGGEWTDAISHFSYICSREAGEGNRSVHVQIVLVVRKRDQLTGSDVIEVSQWDAGDKALW
jgi:hypothetical protein